AEDGIRDYKVTGVQTCALPIYKWSLLIIRDMMFGNRRHYRELLGGSEEGISSNILADRLKTLLAAGIISRDDDPSHKQKGIYSLDRKSTRLNSSHLVTSYAVFCLKKKNGAPHERRRA